MEVTQGVTVIAINHNSFSVLYALMHPVFTHIVACFISHTRHQYQTDKAPKKRYVNQIILFYTTD